MSDLARIEIERDVAEAATTTCCDRRSNDTRPLACETGLKPLWHNMP
jgi:hypothetical protein